MHSRSSASWRQYNRTGQTVGEIQTPVSTISNGESDAVPMHLDGLKRREQTQKLQARLLVGERERIAGQTVPLKAVEDMLGRKFRGRE